MAEKKIAYYVASNGCWVCSSHGNGIGYANVMRRGVRKGAHRIAFEEAYGPIPPGMFVCHSCDNPACINPEHLFLGVARDNVLDCVKKGRRFVPRGELCGSTKLTVGDVKDIRRLAGTVSQRRLANRYRVDQSTISYIVSRKKWRHV